MASTVLITGASSGFGALTVQALLAAGHRVVATMRDPGGRNRAAAEAQAAAGAHIVELDVTDNASVEAGVAAARAAVGDIDVLINNAGVGVIGLVEAFTPEDFQRLFDVNVFGVQRMNRAVAPAMRARGAGLIIHVSSLLGRITIPFYGPYNATKWAVEALAENYRTELSGFGVNICLVEPGGFPTTFIDNLMRPADKARTASYGPMADAPEASLVGFHAMLETQPAQNPVEVANAIVGLIATPVAERPFRTTVDFIGMGTGVTAYNQAHAELTAGIYGNMGMGHLLQVSTGAR